MQVMQVLHQRVTQTEHESKDEMLFLMLKKIQVVFCSCGEMQPGYRHIQHVIYLWNVLWLASKFNRDAEGERVDLNANILILFE